MMSEVIRQETAVFLLAVLLGIGLALLYDALRILRRVFRHGLAATGAEDLLFWLLAAVLLFTLLFYGTGGALRGYVLLGAALGAVLYGKSVSRWLVYNGTHAVQWLNRTIKKCVFALKFHRKRGTIKRKT